MKISPINNTCNQNKKQTQFKADFPKGEIKEFLHDFASHYRTPKEEINSKVYTLLELLKEVPGKVANFVEGSNHFIELHIDNKPAVGYMFATKYEALHDTLIDHEHSRVHYSNIKKISESEFKQRCLKNINKTEKDIQNLSLEA